MGLSFEIKKIAFNKMSFAILAICLVVNAFVIYKKPTKLRRYNNTPAYNNMYAYMEGELTDEKVKYIKANYDVLYEKFMAHTFNPDYNEAYLTGYEAGDFQLYKEIYDKIEYIKSYSDNMEDIRKIAKNNEEYYGRIGNIKLETYNRDIYNRYTDRELFNFYRTNRWKYYLDYAFSNLMILLVLIIALSGVFSMEREEHMSELIITSKCGKIRTYTRKILAGILVAVVVTLLFCIEDFIMFLNVFKLNGTNEPLYSIEEMVNTMYNVSIFEYICIQGVSKVVGMVVIACVIMLASSICRNTLYSIVCAVLGILPMIIFNEKNGICNAIRLLQINNDAKTYVLSYLGRISMVYIYYTIITSIIFGCICLVIAYCLENHSDKIFRRERVNG